MKVSIKTLRDGKWIGAEIKDLIGKSILEVMLHSTETLVACLYENDKAIAFLSNDDKYVNMYKHKGLSLHAKDLLLFMGMVPHVDKVEAVFEGSEIVEIRKLYENVSELSVVQCEN